jgi:hypothetical protein
LNHSSFQLSNDFQVDQKQEAVLGILLKELLYFIAILLGRLVVSPDDHLVQFCLALVFWELLVEVKARSFGYNFSVEEGKVGLRTNDHLELVHWTKFGSK